MTLRPPRVPAAIREALAIWLLSRVAVALVGFAGAWTVHDRRGRDVPSWLSLWQNWDADLFVKVARFGYPPTTAYSDRTEVDFPAMPLALRAVHVLTGNWTAAGLLISLVAGAVAACAVYQLAEQDGGEGAGRRAVLYLVCFPYAVFLFVGYSEALFLAFATTGWLYARRRRWALASLFVAGASFTRLVGLCLALALVVEYVHASWGGRVRSVVRTSALWLVLPFASAFSYVLYLRLRTGHWDAYQRAQEAGWQRHTASVAEGLRNTWRAAQNGDFAAFHVWSWRAETVAVLGGLLLGALLLYRRRYGEATFVGSSAWLLAAQNYYASSVRTALIWFPLYLLLARVTRGRDWLHQSVLAVTAPLMAVFVLAFTRGAFVG